MAINNIELTPAEQATNDLRAAMDSVNLVNELVSSTEYTAANASENVLGSISRNYQHVDIVLKRDHVISNANQDLTPFENCVTVGKDYISAAIAANNPNIGDITVV
jgi:hypothetical protein